MLRSADQFRKHISIDIAARQHDNDILVARIDVTGQVTDPAGTDGVFVIGAAATDPRLAAFVEGAAMPRSPPPGPRM